MKITKAKFICTIISDNRLFHILYATGKSSTLRTAFTDLNLYCIKRALALFVLVYFSGYVC